MKIDSSILKLEEYTSNANSVKQLVLDKLCIDGIISREIHEKYSIEYQVIVVQPSWFRNWMDKFKKTDSPIFKFVKFTDQ